MALFALGFFITIIQIIRIFTIKHLKTYTDSQPIVLWSQVEISLGVSNISVNTTSLCRTTNRTPPKPGDNRMRPHLRPLLPRLRLDPHLKLQHPPPTTPTRLAKPDHGCWPLVRVEWGSSYAAQPESHVTF